jgi:exosome complex RNA-binding protein Rrp4
MSFEENVVVPIRKIGDTTSFASGSGLAIGKGEFYYANLIGYFNVEEWYVSLSPH